MFEAFPWVLGEQIHLFQGNKCPKRQGTAEQRHFWGTGNIGNQDFDFGEQGNKAIYFRGTREQVPSWKDLMF